MKKIMFISLIIYCICSSLFTLTRNWQQLYPSIDRHVTDMKFSTLQGISEWGLLFAFPGNEGGLAYFTSQDSLNTFAVASNLGAVSIVPDESNNRIFCAFGCGSNSDGLYEFDLNTHEFELIGWYFYPRFVNKLSSGFYCGYGFNNDGGLLHSIDGDDWENIDFFNSRSVTDVEENNENSLFIAADNEIYLENNGSYSSITTPSQIMDIYVREHPNDYEVYIACGGGSYSDAVFKVEYENYEITGLAQICSLFQPRSIYEYDSYLVVGCVDYQSNLFLVEPVENGDVFEIGQELGLEAAYCFECYPIYTHNFMVGTDIGVFLATNLTSTEHKTVSHPDILLSNLPNPFKSSTNISFQLTTEHTEHTEINIYNIKGQRVREFKIKDEKLEINEITWDGTNDLGKSVGSGIYFYRLCA